MPPSRWRIPSCLLSLAVAAGCGSAFLAPHPEVREFVLEMRARLPASDDPRPATLWLPVPAADTEQELGPLRVEHRGGAATEAYDEKGNRILSVRGVPPLELAYRVHVRRLRVTRPAEIEESGLPTPDSPWLVSARLAPANRVGKDALLMTAQAVTVHEKVRKLYDHVVESVRYEKPDGGGWGKGDLDWVCDTHAGNCSDFHALFVAYCQSIGVPARFEVGYSLPAVHAPAPLDLGGYHCWARFEVPGFGWLPVDASEAHRQPPLRDFYFGGLSEDRVRVAVGRDLVLNPAQSGEPLNFFSGPYAEQGGSDVTHRVVHEVRFQDSNDS